MQLTDGDPKVQVGERQMGDPPRVVAKVQQHGLASGGGKEGTATNKTSGDDEKTVEVGDKDKGAFSVGVQDGNLGGSTGGALLQEAKLNIEPMQVEQEDKPAREKGEKQGQTIGLPEQKSINRGTYKRRSSGMRPGSTGDPSPPGGPGGRKRRIMEEDGESAASPKKQRGNGGVEEEREVGVD